MSKVEEGIKVVEVVIVTASLELIANARIAISIILKAKMSRNSSNSRILREASDNNNFKVNLLMQDRNLEVVGRNPASSAHPAKN